LPALSRRARAYVLSVAVLAAIMLLVAVPRVHSWPSLVVLSILFLASDSLSVTVLGERVAVASGSIVLIAACMILGPWTAIVGASMSLLAWEPGLAWMKRVFNAATPVLSMALGGLLYDLLGGPVGALDSSDFPRVFLPVLGLVLAYATVNALLVAVIVSLAERLRFRAVLPGVVGFTAFVQLGYGLFGLLMAVLWLGGAGAAGAVLMLLPLFVARWAYAQYAGERSAYEATVGALVQAVETKDYYTRGHSERVAAASVMIARQIGMREDRVPTLRYAGILHDLGKLGVPTKILQKAGPLTDQEFEAIKLHPMRGLEMVRDIAFLREALDGITHHHERMDGRGYPMGLSGMQIPEFARVIAVADAFDSMTSTRSYRGARSLDEAVVELERCRGTQFDPPMVDALIGAVLEQGWSHGGTPEPEDVDLPRVTSLDHDDPSWITSDGQSGTAFIPRSHQ
jgi:HD-GYP domain-containing protein (c-di-GMP phosphodiesterase class II)